MDVERHRRLAGVTVIVFGAALAVLLVVVLGSATPHIGGAMALAAVQPTATFESGDPPNGTPTPTPRYTPTPRSTPTPVPTATPAPPKTPQQITVCPASAVPGGTRSLCDYSNHVWRMNGVQFFLPQGGINSYSFHNNIYAQYVNETELWLGRIRDQVHANLVRIQVEIEDRGDNGATPTSFATLDDFITRATRHNLRVGISLHNNGFFDMSPSKAQWITNFILHYKNDRPDLQTEIAFVSAENEINVHSNDYCSPPDPASSIDCYQNNPGYVALANGWVKAVNSLFKTLPTPDNHSPILVTVGMSTELRRTDGRNPAYNFFVDNTANPSDRSKIVRDQTLAANVDFLSPHNYGGGAAGIFYTISDDWGYTGPAVLEEYGFPTDPYSADPGAPRYPVSMAFREGDPVKDIYGQPNAQPSAAYYVSANIYGLEMWGAKGKAAGAVGAIMADSYDRSCQNPHQDDYTGIFSTNGPYCGGTRTTGEAQLKLTGQLMAAHNLRWGG